MEKSSIKLNDWKEFHFLVQIRILEWEYLITEGMKVKRACLDNFNTKNSLESKKEELNKDLEFIFESFNFENFFNVEIKSENAEIYIRLGVKVFRQYLKKAQ